MKRSLDEEKILPPLQGPKPQWLADAERRVEDRALANGIDLSLKEFEDIDDETKRIIQLSWDILTDPEKEEQRQFNEALEMSLKTAHEERQQKLDAFREERIDALRKTKIPRLMEEEEEEDTVDLDLRQKETICSVMLSLCAYASLETLLRLCSTSKWTREQVTRIVMQIPFQSIELESEHTLSQITQRICCLHTSPLVDRLRDTVHTIRIVIRHHFDNNDDEKTTTTNHVCNKREKRFDITCIVLSIGSTEDLDHFFNRIDKAHSLEMVTHYCHDNTQPSLIKEIQSEHFFATFNQTRKATLIDDPNGLRYASLSNINIEEYAIETNKNECPIM